ncbi:MAG: methyl-accepting chemotaxis protein [Vicinamibacteria bacterium]
MARNWTFAQRLAAGFAACVLLTIVVAAVAVRALSAAVESKDSVISGNALALIEAQRLGTAREEKGSAARAFLLTREERQLDKMRVARRDFGASLGRLRTRATAAEERALLDGIEEAEAEHQAALDRVIELRRGAATIEAVSRAFDDDAGPKRDQLHNALASFISREEKQLEDARRESSAAAASAMQLVVGISVVAVLAGALLALALARALTRQIGGAVGRVQSSSTELQSAATQQATGAREQATAMSEITTTISELLATSRQIAESAQRVAQIAGQTAQAARSGGGTVEKADESISAIRRQTDLVVGHMLELGKRSQQIGAVVEIVSELAEQTNILSINASIEAAGAGEAGRRFAVVADEIRKLADRVALSAKEIRGLVEDVRGSVNTTVMATESGSKAVDAGSRQFAEVASAFKQIAALVSTTTEAAREIELSTQQQTTAVGQVNVAISNVAQATRETEASSGQTLQTAGALAGLSRELLLLVRSEAAA